MNLILLVINFTLVDDTKLDWYNFVHDCGRKVYIDNAVRAKRIYNFKYHKKAIEWEGVYKEFTHFRDKSVLFIKMNPSDSAPAFPDLAIFFKRNTPEEFNTIKAIKETVKVGDIIQFEAIFNRLGNEFTYHEMDIISTKFTGEHFNYDEIPMIMDQTGFLRNSLPDKS